MLKKFLLLTLTLSATLNTANAQKTTEIPNLVGEKWWGAMTALGPQTPFTSTNIVPLSSRSYNNQNVPLLVSNYGRYIAATVPFDFKITAENVQIFAQTDTIKVRRSGKTLRTGHYAAMQTFFKPSGTIPPAEFFAKPQYNTWIELNFNQNQKDILAYAKGIIESGLPAGILMIDDTWQRYFGSYDFKAERFEDPVAMIEELHYMGFKVMLWISPFVSPDSQEFRDLEKADLLVKTKEGKTAIIPWWNGYSAVYDLTNPMTNEYLLTKLKETQAKYNVDGFKFDAGDLDFYNPQTQTYYDKNATAADHSMKWAQLALKFPYNELRACWAMQGQALVQRLGDKDYSWQALELLVPEMINAGLMGYAYTCPDLIGGGQINSFSDVQNQKFDQSLIVRSTQIHAMMPMMQFSVAPWRILDKEHMAMVTQAVKLHEKIAPYILELAKESAITGEPIVRSMEYNFAAKGFSECKDQYMIGTKYIVAPITSPENKRLVRLPAGRWTDDLGFTYRGPVVLEVSAPLNRIPFYESKK